MTRLTLDASTGNTDLAWNLVLIFFLTTFIALRPATEGVRPADGGVQGTPLVLAAGAEGAGIEAVHVVAGAPTTLPVADVLARHCTSRDQVASLRCPDERSHRSCRELLQDLARRAPTCTWQY